MFLLQKLYLCVFNSIYRYLKKIPYAFRNIIICTCCGCLVFFFVLYFTPRLMDVMVWEHTRNHIICGLILFILAVFSVKEELDYQPWNKAVFYLLFLSGFGILAISFLHPVGSGYRVFALLLMFGFPGLYFVWNNRRDYNVFYEDLSVATVVVGAAYYCYCFYYACNGWLKAYGGRVDGTFYDANQFSMIGMIMVLSGLYLISAHLNGKRSMTVIGAIGIGIGTDIIILGGSRLAIVIVLGSFFSAIIFYFKRGRHKERRNDNKKEIVFIAGIVGLFIIFFVLVGAVMVSINIRICFGTPTERMITGINNSGNSVIEIATKECSQEVKVQAEPTVDSGSTASEPSEDDTNNSVFDRFDIRNKSINKFTNGRYVLWKNYARYLNLTGNDFSKADWEALTDNTVRHAHNNFLEIAYRCGVPVACLHALLELIAGIICLIWLFNPKYKEPYFLFCIMFMICYTVQSLFDIATLPFERPAPFYFYMMMIPVFTFGTEKKRNQYE